MKDDLISRQAAKNKKVYSEERHEYVVPVAEIDWLPSAQPEARERTKNIRQICEEIIKWGKLVLKYNGKDIVFVPCNDSEDHNNKE